MRILIIEGDLDTAEAIRDEVSKHYVADVAYSGMEGAYLSQVNDYDVIVLDHSVPDINGVELCKMVRDANVCSPIMFLTQNTDIGHKIYSLDSGADDCLTKPVNYAELLARLRALMRRRSVNFVSNKLVVCDLVLDLLNKTAYRDGMFINLRRREFDLLEFLVRNKGKVVSREKILEHVWEKGDEVMSNTIEVHIRNLRNKIDKPFEKKLIKTIHTLGYKIEG